MLSVVNKPIMLNVAMLSVANKSIMNVVMMSVVMLNVVASIELPQILIIVTYFLAMGLLGNYKL